MKRMDRHHIFWCKKDYNKGWARRLRDHWYCVVKIPTDTIHHQIHHEMDCIPVPKVFSIKKAFEQLDMLEKYGAIHSDDDIEKRLKVLLALFDCIEPATADALRKQLDIVHRH